MPVRAALLSLALILPALVSTAEAAPFDDLKADLAACLRFERAGMPRRVAAADERALQRCAGEIGRLDRADGRRLRGDHGLSPSTWTVIEDVFGRGGRTRPASRPF